MKTENELILRNGMFIRRHIQEEAIGHQQAILSACMEAPGALIRRVLYLGGIPIHMIVHPSAIYVFCRIPEVMMRVHLTEDPKTKELYPDSSHGSNAAFYHGAAPANTVTIREPWSVPADIGHLYFFQKFTLTPTRQNSPRGNYFITGSAFLLLRCRKTGELYAPYLPNIHANGTVCMGDEWNAAVASKITSLTDGFIKAHNIFTTTPHSNHIMTSTEKVHALFRRPANSATWSAFPKVEDYGMLVSNAQLMPIVNLPEGD
jgi:hypothetical protein